MYADYTWYENEYLLGREPVILDEDFPFWEKKARRAIDQATCNRIPALSELPDIVKDCTCELAEFMYKADKLEQENLANGAAGVLASYSNDGQSGTYDVSQSAYTAEGRRQETLRIIRGYLADTGLMYRGVWHSES